MSSIGPARPPISGATFNRNALRRVFAENAEVIKELGSAAAVPSNKVQRQAIINAYTVLLRDLPKFTTWTNEGQTQMSSVYNGCAKNLQLLLTKALSNNKRKFNKINADLIVNLLSLKSNAEATGLVEEFMKKESWNTKDSSDRDLLRRMLELLQTVVTDTSTSKGGKRGSKKHKKQRRRHTRRQK